MPGGILITHRGAVRVPKDELYLIDPPEATETWKPVRHGVLVDHLTAALQSRGIQVRKEEYAVQRDGNLLFGVMDLAWHETQDTYAALGLRTSNDKTFAIQIAIGMRVVVCDNLLMSGELIALKRKHTSGLDLVGEFSGAVDRYMFGYRQLEKRVERLKEREVSVSEARECVYTLFARTILPLRLFAKVATPYVKDVGPPTSLWHLHNLCTDALKDLKPSVAFETNIRLGKFFALGELFTSRPEQSVSPTHMEGLSSRWYEEGTPASVSSATC